MNRRTTALLLVPLSPFLLLGQSAEAPEDGGYVFRSDVSLVRVDAQVVDRENRAVTSLGLQDFMVYENGQARELRNFAKEDLPADVLLLLDVSGSMRPHLQRIASASHEALQVLGPEDRVAIMVFDRGSRIRLPFRNSRADVQQELDYLLNAETFDGGTDVTRGLLDAAEYVGREGRREARRAIVIVTDDETERGRDERRVLRSLAEHNVVLSALLAPNAMRSRGVYSGGGGWPSAGGTLGGIIFGRRGPLGGGSRGPVIINSRTQRAGSAEIARDSGGDSMRVDEAQAFRTTLTRIRQRYALYFALPEGVKPGQERDIRVELTASAARRHPGAEVRYRRESGSAESSIEVARTERVPDRPREVEPVDVPDGKPTLTPGPHDARNDAPPPAGAQQSGGWRRATQAEIEDAARPPETATTGTQRKIR
jgi:VWFA-related protein